jgi:hypothetical protein
MGNSHWHNLKDRGISLRKERLQIPQNVDAIHW